MSESKALPAYKQEAKVPITRELREQFLCPICRDTIENAHRVFPCLHYFCGDCIRMNFSTIRNVENGKVRHHCPSCRHVIPSKRHIVKDSKFDDLIRSLNCSREDNEDDQQIDISTYQQNHNARVLEMKTYQSENKERILSQPYQAPVSSSSTGKKTTSLKRGRKPKPKGGADEKVSRLKQAEPEPVEDLTKFFSGPVNFSLKYYNPENPNDKELNLQYNLIRPYVRADCSTTIHDLKLLVCSYFTKYEEATVDIYACSTKHATMIYLKSDMTLIEYCTRIWNRNSSIVFFYAFKPTLST